MLRPDDVLTHLRKKPFLPFRIHLTDGTAYEVKHPELLMVGERFLVIGKPRPGADGVIIDTYDTAALMHVVRLEPLPMPAAG